jgi:hypothetical protein
MSETLERYRLAAEILWGEAGTWAVDEFRRHNERFFGGALPPLPIIFGLTAYGKCIGLTRQRGTWGELPRITLYSGHFHRKKDLVSDTLLHEMIHARLLLEGKDPDHNGAPWCAEVVRLTPLLLGFEVKARPVHPRRIDGKNRRVALEGHLSRQQLARWPESLRESGSYRGERIKVATC